MVHQDKDVSLDVVHKFIEGLEEDHFEGGSTRERENVTDVTVFVLFSFLIALRGERDREYSLGGNQGIL